MTSKLLFIASCFASIIVFPRTAQMLQAGWSIQSDLSAVARSQFGTLRVFEAGDVLGVHLVSSESAQGSSLKVLLVVEDQCEVCREALSFWVAQAQTSQEMSMSVIAVGEGSRAQAVDGCHGIGRRCSVYQVNDIEAFRLSSGVGVVPASLVSGHGVVCAIFGQPSAAAWTECRRRSAGQPRRSPVIWGEGGRVLSTLSLQ